MDIDTILKAYRDGDMGQRLNLFLMHRDLRDSFMDMERKELDAAGLEKQAPSQAAKGRPGGWCCRRLISACSGAWGRFM